jgi:SH3-like domain-containing protein
MMARLFGIAVVAWLAFDVTLARGSDPYQATVVGKGVSVRSGPGLKYYATDFLEPGSTVDIYDDRGEWLAIRPPQGSFSWVPARHVTITENPRIGTVNNVDVPCRVGTRYSHAHDVEFVRLKKGENVGLVDRDELVEQDGTTEIWYKIEPPAGEFRWLPRAAVQSATENSSASDPTDASNWMIVDEQPASTEEPTLGSIAKQISAALHEATGDDAQEEESNASAAVPTAGAAVMPSIPGTSIRPEVLENELLTLEWKLTETVALGPTDWELAPLRARVQTIIDLSPNADIRGQASHTLAKIAQFEDLQRRHLQLAAAQAENVASRPPSIADLLGGTVTAAGLSASGGTRADYAGTGWLMPLVTRRDGMPRYALTDKDGNIVQFITPAPGINLNPYTRKRIGVYGQRGFIPDLNKPHLMAERIVSLDRVR